MRISRVKMLRVIRVRYENGVFKPLEPVDLDEGEEVLVTVKRDVRRVLKKYLGVLGRSSIRELLELEEEAHVR
jgi:predicted DNA-binding antitoxin AbrB/MazE fold protein